MKRIKASVEKIQAEINRLIQELEQIQAALEAKEKTPPEEKSR